MFLAPEFFWGCAPKKFWTAL